MRIGKNQEKEAVCIEAKMELQINISGKTFYRTPTLALFTVMLIRFGPF